VRFPACKAIRSDRVFRCLKDGTVVESGTHEELLALKGEYAQLYHVQAQAFSSEVRYTPFRCAFVVERLIIRHKKGKAT
jgi:hypothetical protein